jgi:murein DD-endopeptidase MepM/ murein hydrolase activator NlpD
MSRLKIGTLALTITVFALMLVASLGTLARGTQERVPPWTWPLKPPPTVVNGFDPPEDPWGSGHRGVDLLGQPGQSVMAVAAGSVSFAGRIAGRGVVVVRHGALRSTYEPVTPMVDVGDKVAAADPIATLTTAHSHCLPATCLHLGAKRGDVYLDPMDFLGGGPIRLKPLRRDVDNPVASTGDFVAPTTQARPHRDSDGHGPLALGLSVVGAAGLGVALARVTPPHARG